LLFIVTGYLGFTFFYSVVQTAWVNAGLERASGTLETLFLTPANRLALVIGNSLMGLLESVWMFFVFAAVVIVAQAGGHASALALLVSFVIILLPAVGWGTFLTAFMLFARDAGLIYTVLDDPMQFFSGVRFPVAALPLWGRLASLLFPLTFSLRVVRGLLVEGADLAGVARGIALALGATALLVVAAVVVLRVGERRAKRTGSLILF
jgi:ABC-2 type transport system permease protein